MIELKATPGKKWLLDQYTTGGSRGKRFSDPEYVGGSLPSGK